MQEERVMHEAKLAKMEAEMKMVFQQKVQEKEAKLKQSEEELYARHREMKEALEKQRQELDKALLAHQRSNNSNATVNSNAANGSPQSTKPVDSLKN